MKNPRFDSLNSRLRSAAWGALCLVALAACDDAEPAADTVDAIGTDTGADATGDTTEADTTTGDTSCTNACTTAGTACNGTVVETCAMAASGCLALTTEECAGTAAPACVDDGSSAACAASCTGTGPDIVCGSDDHTYYSDMCGEPTTKKGNCSSSLPCEVNTGDGQGYCSCQLTGVNECKIGGSLSTLYEETYIQKERKCSNTVPEPTDFIEDCGFGTVCFHDDKYNNNEPLCHRSIDASQAASPYYDYGCGLFSMWLRNPTKLPIDCRCRTTGNGQGGAGGTTGTGNGYVDPTQDPPYYPGGPVINCATADQQSKKDWAIDYGTGPNFNAWYQQNKSGASWFSGVVNPATREMFAIIKWSNPDYVSSASIVAWNLDTGNRRVVTGLHPDPQFGLKAYGSGYLSPKPGNTGTVTEQPLSGATVVRLHSDGMLYTFGGSLGQSTSSTREIVRTDPTTGERTLVWLSQGDSDVDLTATYGQCFRPDALGKLQSVSLQGQAFEVGPDGTFYVSMHGIREGDGLLSISKDGKTCTPLSRWGGTGHNPGGGVTAAPALTPIGGGFDIGVFPVQGLLYHEGVVHGVSNDEMYAFNLTSGDRSKDSWTNGTYTGMGFANVFWDPTRNVIWAVGTVASYVGSIVDPTTGRRESIYGDSTDWGDQAIMKSDYSTAHSVASPSTTLTNGNPIHYGGVILDPDNNDIVFAVTASGGLMKLELSTFNNYIFSY